MCSPRTFVLAFISLSFACPIFAQQSATSATQNSPQALTLLQQSLAALTVGKSITDITLSGTVRRIAGSDDETGTVTYKALGTGAARFDFSYPSGLRSEVRSTIGLEAAGVRTGPDGVSHPIPHFNLQNSADNFPAFTLARLLSSQEFVVSLIGLEIKNGVSVYHISACQQFPDMSGSMSKLFQHLTQIDIFLDASTFLPVAFHFNTHPEDNGLMDLPTEILFSDYRILNGTPISFRMQKYVNNGLTLDIEVQSVAVNSGLPADTFQVQ